MNISEITICPVCDEALNNPNYSREPGMRTIHNDKDHVVLFMINQEKNIEGIYATIQGIGINWELSKNKISVHSYSNSSNGKVEFIYVEPKASILKNQIFSYINKYKLSKIF